MLKIILFLFLVFMCTNIFAQNNFRALGQIKAGMKSLNSYKNEFLFIQDNVVSHKYSFINLSGQVLVGSALAIVFSIPPLAIAVGSSFSNHYSIGLQSTLGIITLSSYLFGAAVGVYWVAKSQNSKLSFWGTVGYSVIGGSISAVLISILATQYNTIPSVGGSIAALFPIVGSMIYASFVSDWPQEPHNISFVENGLTQKDLFENSKLFNVELFRIKL